MLFMWLRFFVFCNGWRRDVVENVGGVNESTCNVNTKPNRNLLDVISVHLRFVKKDDVQLIVIKSQATSYRSQYVGASNFLSLTTYLKWSSKPTNALRYHM
jgi:hypothetical protein